MPLRPPAVVHQSGDAVKLTRISWKGFGIPFRGRYVTSSSSATVRYGLLLFLHTDTGLVGIGEASPVGTGSEEEVRMTASRLEGLVAQLLRTDQPTSAGVLSRLPAGVPPALRFGLETALLDMEGKASGGTVAELLGGDPLLWPSVNALIAAETPEEAVAEAKEMVAQECASIKLKVTAGTVAQDEALVSAVRRAIGPDVKLRIDANQGWSVDEAVDAIQRLTRYGLEYVEQPVAASDMAGLAKVRSAVSVPIAADESLASLDDLHRLIDLDAVDVLVVKAGRLGGLDRAAEVMRAALNAGKATVVTSSLESGVGIAASAHLAATLPSHPYAHGLATGILLEQDLLTPSLLVRHGAVAPLQKPGLGVEVDMTMVDRYGIGIEGSVSS